MKKHIRSTISLILLFGVLIANLATAQAVVTRYIGVSRLLSSLTISSNGAALCKGEVSVDSGYTVEVKVELKQDGSTIKTWTASGSGTVQVSETHYVQSGHNYIVKTTATVYDSDGRWVEAPYKNSAQKSY